MYRHKISGKYLKLLRSYRFNINVFLEVDSLGIPIIKTRSWSTGKQEHEQTYIIKGFDKLVKLSHECTRINKPV